MAEKSVSNDMPKSVPTTGRTPDFLAMRYGFKNVADLCKDIPKNAAVIDAGAGMSLLGHAVGRLRPDVTWINLDPYYKNPRHLLAATDASKNVQYIAGDITKPSTEIMQLRPQRIYSYWMLPHLSVHSNKPLARAAGSMWDLLTSDGHIRIGPVYPHRFSSIWLQKRYLTLTKQQERSEVVAQIVSVMRLPAGCATGKLFRILHICGRF